MPDTPEATAEEVARRSEAAWRSVAPAGPGPQAVLRHGRRVARIVLADGAEDAIAARAVTAAALLHEVGRFLPGTGHYAARGARWVAVRLDEMIPGVTEAERRLVGELILFHRHRGPLPPELSRRDVVDAFRRAEEADLRGGADESGSPRSEPRGPLAAALRRSDLRELLRHPLTARRVVRVRRPDR